MFVNVDLDALGGALLLERSAEHFGRLLGDFFDVERGYVLRDVLVHLIHSRVRATTISTQQAASHIDKRIVVPFIYNG